MQKVNLNDNRGIAPPATFVVGKGVRELARAILGYAARYSVPPQHVGYAVYIQED